mmetsp:Transcript_61419/g.193582  ORF Transcript_61419/g.193582 Transcript_61419/m.193582 type:complete len:470 (-) Transcript_61419:530-1939(-)
MRANRQKQTRKRTHGANAWTWKWPQPLKVGPDGIVASAGRWKTDVLREHIPSASAERACRDAKGAYTCLFPEQPRPASANVDLPHGLLREHPNLVLRVPAEGLHGLDVRAGLGAEVAEGAQNCLAHLGLGVGETVEQILHASRPSLTHAAQCIHRRQADLGVRIVGRPHDVRSVHLASRAQLLQGVDHGDPHLAAAVLEAFQQLLHVREDAVTHGPKRHSGAAAHAWVLAPQQLHHLLDRRGHGAALRLAHQAHRAGSCRDHAHVLVIEELHDLRLEPGALGIHGAECVSGGDPHVRIAIRQEPSHLLCVLAALRAQLGQGLQGCASRHAQRRRRLRERAGLGDHAGGLVLETVAQERGNLGGETCRLLAHLAQHHRRRSLFTTGTGGKFLCHVLGQAVRVLAQRGQGCDGRGAHEHVVIREALADAIGVPGAKGPHLGEVEQGLRLGLLVCGLKELGNLCAIRLCIFS